MQPLEYAIRLTHLVKRYPVRTYTVYNAKTHLSRLIEKACAGEEIIIAKGRTPKVKLVALAETQGRRFGAMRGQAQVTEAFFDPLPEEELQAWEK